MHKPPLNQISCAQPSSHRESLGDETCPQATIQSLCAALGTRTARDVPSAKQANVLAAAIIESGDIARGINRVKPASFLVDGRQQSGFVTYDLRAIPPEQIFVCGLGTFRIERDADSGQAMLVAAGETPSSRARGIRKSPRSKGGHGNEATSHNGNTEEKTPRERATACAPCNAADLKDQGKIRFFAGLPMEGKCTPGGRVVASGRREYRRKYFVKPGDTLESIAEFELDDVHLACLIHSINAKSIPIVVKAGRILLHLRPGLILHLPTSSEVQTFLNRSAPGDPERFEYLCPDHWQAEELSAEQPEHHQRCDISRGSEAKRQRAFIEAMLGALPSRNSTGRLTYTVRLHDTLKSVCAQHPALKNESLWPLLAEINGLSADADHRSQVRLKRGSVLEIPTADEIQSYKNRKICPAIPYTVLHASMHQAPVRESVSSAKAKPCLWVDDDSERQVIAQETQIQRLAETARLVRADLGSGRTEARLEALCGGSWLPVVSYCMEADLSVRYEFKLDGSRSCMQIDLPPLAVKELMENDLAGNWDIYCDKFRAGRRLTD